MKFIVVFPRYSRIYGVFLGKVVCFCYHPKLQHSIFAKVINFELILAYRPGLRLSLCIDVGCTGFFTSFRLIFSLLSFTAKSSKCFSASPQNPGSSKHFCACLSLQVRNNLLLPHKKVKQSE